MHNSFVLFFSSEEPLHRKAAELCCELCMQQKHKGTQTLLIKHFWKWLLSLSPLWFIHITEHISELYFPSFLSASCYNFWRLNKWPHLPGDPWIRWKTTRGWFTTLPPLCSLHTPFNMPFIIAQCRKANNETLQNVIIRCTCTAD